MDPTLETARTTAVIAVPCIVLGIGIGLWISKRICTRRVTNRHRTQLRYGIRK